jgi:hypothetical protein
VSCAIFETFWPCVMHPGWASEALGAVGAEGPGTTAWCAGNVVVVVDDDVDVVDVVDVVGSLVPGTGMTPAADAAVAPVSAATVTPTTISLRRRVIRPRLIRSSPCRSLCCNYRPVAALVPRFDQPIPSR